MAADPEAALPEDGAESSRLVRELVAEVDAGASDGTLPSLTREDLFTLSDAPTLEHPGDVAWWTGLDDGGRDLVRQTAERGLLARQLLTSSPDGTAFVLDPRVHVIARARAEPSWLLVLGEPANSDVQIVGYGIDLAARETAAVLVSARLEGVYLNRLLPPATAIDVLIEWLTRPTPGSEPTGRTVELITPHTEGDERREQHIRAIVLASNDAYALAEVDPAADKPGEPEPVDEAALRAWVATRVPADSRPR
ncbi:hypothetical protein [uncultured Jatrophihabitans sp.]|uniref:hypothetical protein n=1 Tax=uncultured Jatrophihabitans sp. TaxID=1610747 RepID=UPI0035CA09D1